MRILRPSPPTFAASHVHMTILQGRPEDNAALRPAFYLKDTVLQNTGVEGAIIGPVPRLPNI